MQPRTPEVVLPRRPVYRAVTDDKGKFRGTTNEPDDGLPVGKYAVAITWPVLMQEDPDYEQDRFGWRYADLRAPAFVFEVLAPSTEMPPFELQ